MFEQPIPQPLYDDPQHPEKPGNFGFIDTELVKNKAKSKELGRPIYDERVFIHIRGPGMEKQEGVFEIIPPDELGRGGNVYYHRYEKQYKAWKTNGVEGVSGTPLQELPFMTKAIAAELRGVKIYTAEQLASISDNTLVHMGPIIRDFRDKAKLYMDHAKGMEPLAKMQAEMQRMREELDAEKANNKNLAASIANAQPKKEKLTLGKGEAA